MYYCYSKVSSNVVVQSKDMNQTAWIQTLALDKPWLGEVPHP